MDKTYGTNPKLMINMNVDTTKLKELMDKFKIQQPNPYSIYNPYGISPISVAIKELQKSEEEETRKRYLNHMLYSFSRPASPCSVIKSFDYIGEPPESVLEVCQKLNEMADRIILERWLKIGLLGIGILLFIMIWSYNV